MLPGQMSPWKLASVKDGSRNLPLEFCQNWVSNIWNIHDMGKFCQDQCFLDKCDHYSWNRGSQELPLKFGQNWVSNSWNIAYMDKCRQDKCCMEKMWLWQLASVKRVPVTLGTYLESLVKIGPVTAEILLIWTNVARTNVVWTSVTVLVYICQRGFREPTCKVWWKLGQ